MARVVYQILIDQPLKPEPPLAMIHRFKLAPEKPTSPGGWDFLHHSLDSVATNEIPQHQHQQPTPAVAKNDDFAPAPVRQLPPVKLSDRSLQLCTENLGNETGTNDISEGDSLFDNLRNSENPVKSPAFLISQPSRGRKVIARAIPPPLTTLRGPETLQVRARREEGRLVINAVKSPPEIPHFRAERSDGWLRLSLNRIKTSDESPETKREVNDHRNRRPSLLSKSSHGPNDKVSINRNDTNVTNSSTELKPFQFTEEDYYREDDDASKFAPTIRTWCNEGEHDHCHRNRGHQSMMPLNWEPLWVATS